MIISKEVFPYIVNSNDSIEFSLEKINKNNRKIIYCVEWWGKSSYIPLTNLMVNAYFSLSNWRFFSALYPKQNKGKLKILI